jgi:asparagine synthetase B (glutamine-hydrolysing)
VNGMVLVAAQGVAPVLPGAVEDERGYTLMCERHTSVSASDILMAYHHWGEACARHVCGDFAFVLWDAHNRRLLAARSITARCPLYVAQHARGICFASDPGTLLNQVPSDPDLSWVAGWLLRSEDGWNCSPWQAIHPVLPGHTLVYELPSGQRRTHASWVPPTRLSVKDLSFAEATERFRSLFWQAIITRLQEHCHVSFDCSGGLDSSAIVASVAYLQEKGRLPHGAILVLHGYSEHFPEEDGRSYLLALTRRYPAITPRCINYDTVCMQPLVAKAEPYPTTQAIVLPALFQERERQIASFGSTLHLLGEFGDHLFAPTIRWLWHQRPWQMAHQLREWRGLCAPQRLLSRAWLADRSARLRRSASPSWITREAQHYAWHAQQQREQILRQWLPDPFQRALISSMLRDQTLVPRTELQQAVAFPYLDQALLEFFCACPVPWLMAPWQQPKALLRAAMQDILPEPIRQRTDKGNATRIVAFWSRQQGTALKTLAERLAPLFFVEQEGLISAIDRMGYGDCRDQRFVYASLALALAQKGKSLYGSH